MLKLVKRPQFLSCRSFKTTPKYLCEEDEPIERLTVIKEKIGFIGDGNMARAIFKGIVNKGLIKPSQVHVSSPYIKNLDRWKILGANISTDNAKVMKLADVVFLAVKPHILPAAIASIKNTPDAADIKHKLFLSILAGFKIEKLEELLSGFVGGRVVRLMPNTPMMVGAGCTAFCPGNAVTNHDLMIVRAILEATGICHKVPENIINAVGAVSGGGPAFVYLMIEALSDGGVRMGMHRAMATKFAAQTVMGAAKMVLETGKHTGQLKDDVCSAGGTTIAGMHELERGRVRGSIMNAVEASAMKADELGKR